METYGTILTGRGRGGADLGLCSYDQLAMTQGIGVICASSKGKGGLLSRFPTQLTGFTIKQISIVTHTVLKLTYVYLSPLRSIQYKCQPII